MGCKTILRSTHDSEDGIKVWKAPRMYSINWITQQLSYIPMDHFSTSMRDKVSFHQCPQRPGFLGKSPFLCTAVSADPQLAQSRTQFWKTTQDMVRTHSKWGAKNYVVKRFECIYSKWVYNWLSLHKFTKWAALQKFIKSMSPLTFFLEKYLSSTQKSTW